MSNFATDASNPEVDPIVPDCDSSYLHEIEILKFSIQFFYLTTGILINLIILWTVWWKCREKYMKYSFFVLFSMDCLVNAILLLTEGLMARFFIYFTPICTSIGPYFANPLIFFKGVMVLIHHCKICKSILQSLLVLNRMTCVLAPFSYATGWKKVINWTIPIVFLIPLSVDWNLIISRVYMQSTYGGFWLSYFKKVSWASQSRFQLIFILIAMGFTIICTFITLITLIKLPKRVKEVERSITYANVIISISFLFVAVFQIYYSFFFTYSNPSSPVYGFSLLSYDFLNIGSPIVMLTVSSSLRKHTFSWKKTAENESVFTIRSRSK